MKILVIGGTGLIGRKVTAKLNKAGHEAIVGVPGNGINILTGQGLSDALTGTDIVIDLSNSASPEEEAAIHFFETAGKNLAEAEKAAGIKHHLLLSIVGTDRAQYIGYLKAKKIQEDLIKQSGIPFTVVRSSQFHEHTGTIIAVQSEGKQVHVSKLDYQPIAAEDVAEIVVRLSLEAPKNDTVEIAGPERAPMNEFVERYLKAKGEDQVVIANDDNRYMFFDLPKSGLVPLGEFTQGATTFHDWLRQ